MKITNYQFCELEEHDSEFLNMVCIDESCNKRQLLCNNCIEDHQRCKKIPLKKFAKQFHDQINCMNLENQKCQYSDLIVNFENIEETLQKAQEKIIEIFNKTKLMIDNVKKEVNKNFNSQDRNQRQLQIILKFQEEPSQLNYKLLIDEIESFKPNNDMMSFTVKRNTSNQINQQNIENGKIYVQQLQGAINTLIDQFQSLNEVLRTNIQDNFQKTPIKMIEQEKNDKSMEKQLKSNVMSSNRQVQQQINPKENQIIQIEDDSIIIEGNKDGKKEIVQTVDQREYTMDQLKKMMDINSGKKEQLDQRKNNNNNNNNNNNVVEQQQRNEQPGKEAQEQEENETVLSVTLEKQFQFMSGGLEISKMIFINKQLIGGIGGSKFMLHDLSIPDSERTRVHTIQNEYEYTDMAYLELDEQNGSLYLATKRGYVYVYIKEGIKNITFKLGSNHPLDIKGMLLIQVNPIDRQLYSVGEEKIVKVWSLKTMREINRLELQDSPTAFYSNQKHVFIGGNKFIKIWEQTSGICQTLKNLEQKVTSILTNEQKLFVSMIDKIKIYNQTINGEYHLTQDVPFGNIRTIQIFKTWPMLIISYNEKQMPRTSLYHYIDQSPCEVLFESEVQCCIVREQNKVNFLAFGLEKGKCCIYKMEQTFQPSQ
ncbi:unnamed protein product [Paramecium sonneborni]|uniref:Uncharacterized protein n=1 Tax=Paramecium sonneborni TaxID=65129 RepID=A0A8S1QSJ8_9CILI|nr:unnamed protein product [Paramecium sonneborni]